MPEGDTLHRIALAAAPRLVGNPVLRAEAPRLEVGLGGLVGRTITGVAARGKYLVITFDETVVLLTHLRMTGRWHFYDPGERWRYGLASLSVLLAVAGTEACCFRAPLVRLVRANDLEAFVGARALGPDILDDAFEPARALANLRRAPDVPIGEALLDQSRVSGIGNVWKSEMLFRARLDPFAPVSTVADDALRSLLERTCAAMRANVVRPSRFGARPASAHYAYTRDSSLTAARTTRAGCEVGKGPIAVYGRSGDPCMTCGVPIAMRRQGHARRSTYFCASCQAVR